jgi:hypothetical protein
MLRLQRFVKESQMGELIRPMDLAPQWQKEDGAMRHLLAAHF